MKRARFLILAIVWCVAVAGCGKKGKIAECGDCLEQGYHLKFYNSAPLASTAVLFSGWRNGRCQTYLLCAGKPEAYLGQVNPGALDWHCSEEELIVFSPDHAAAVATVDRSATELSVPLNPGVQVNVTLWIVSNVSSVADAQLDAENARGVYADFATGIDLVFDVEPFPNARFLELDGNPTKEGNIYNSADCDLASSLSGMAGGAPGYEPGFRTDELNVYYVAQINPSSGAAAGINCGYPPYERQDIMFIDGDYGSSPAALAHELGHALGLRRAVTLPGAGREQYGHVDELKLDPYLSATNLMESTVGKVEQITVGQIYRMNYDKLSWLWYAQASNPMYPRECQGNPVDAGPCPPLTLHPSGTWP